MSLVVLCVAIGPAPTRAASQAGSQLNSDIAKPSGPHIQNASPEEATLGSLGHPYTLPAAPRARMHECGIEWQRMKMSGAADDKTWRVFASVCLTSQDKVRQDKPEAVNAMHGKAGEQSVDIKPPGSGKQP